MQGRLFYGIGIGFASGIFIRSFFDPHLSFVFLPLLVACSCFIASRVRGGSRALIFLSCVLISLSVGMFRLHVSEAHVSALLPVVGKEVSVTGHVVREPEFREATIHLYIRPSGIKERVLVTLDRYTTEHFTYGDIVTVRGVLEEPEPFETDIGRTFNYAGYLRARGVQVMIPYAEVENIESGNPSFLALLYQGKVRFMETLEEIVPEPSAGLGEGVLLGVKRALGPELDATFRETGLIHIVVLSGYNIMVVVSGLMYVLSHFFFPKTRLVIGILAVTAFALLVGPSATVVRASLMATLLLVAQTTGRVYEVLRALLLVGVFMLFHNPYLLVHDPGFQLSFVATFGLIILSPYMERLLERIPSRFGLKEVGIATVATQLFVLPLLLFHTGLLSIVSIAANMTVLPMVPIAMGLTALTGMFGIFLPFLGHLVGFFAHLSLMYIVYAAEFFGSLPLASVTIPFFPWWAMVIAYAMLAQVVWKLSQKPDRVSIVYNLSCGPEFIEQQRLPFK